MLFGFFGFGDSVTTGTFTYVCDDSSCQGYVGKTLENAEFDNNISEFSEADYNNIDDDDDNYVLDNITNTDYHIYHKFDFSVPVDGDEFIKSIKATWKGETYTEISEGGYSYARVMYIKKGSSWDVLVTSGGSGKKTLSDTIIHSPSSPTHEYYDNGIISFGVYNTWEVEEGLSGATIKSYYVELEIVLKNKIIKIMNINNQVNPKMYILDI